MKLSFLQKISVALVMVWLVLPALLLAMAAIVTVFEYAIWGDQPVSDTWKTGRLPIIFGLVLASWYLSRAVSSWIVVKVCRHTPSYAHPVVRMIERLSMRTVTDEELLDILNSELLAYDVCANCRFTSVQRTALFTTESSNWSASNLRGSGTPTNVCEPIANQIVSRARRKYKIHV